MHAVTLPNDIIVAEHDQFDRILADIDDSLALDVTEDGGVSIDDVVTIVAIYRDEIDDRQKWRKIRRDVYSRFASHADISSRTLAAVPDAVRNEVAGFDEKDIAFISDSWVTHDGATPMNADHASQSLRAFVNACLHARKQSKSVFLRTTQPRNAFQAAFSKLEGKQLENFRKSFSKWDAIKKYKAHERFNYYQKRGEKDCLNLVLRDFSRPKTRLELRQDRKVLREYILKRIRDYSKADNIGPGETNAAIGLITVGYYADQGGYVNLVFDTREQAEVDGEWTLYIDNRENTCEFPHWNDACKTVYEGGKVSAIRHDGVSVTLSESLDDKSMQAVFGDMIVDVVKELRDNGAFSALPLKPNAYVVVEEFDGQFFWPTYETRKTDGRIAQHRG